MRTGLDTPTEVVPPEQLARLRDYLDAQSAVALAVWVRHEQPGVGGPLYDHRTMLGVDDERYARGDMRAFERGIESECSFPGRCDVFPRSEVEELRDVGEVLWERLGSPVGELDRLDFRFTHEPIAVTPDARGVFVELVRNVAPGVVHVRASHARLWKGEAELEGSTWLYVGWDASRRWAPNTLTLVLNAAREAGIGDFAVTWGPLVEPSPYPTVLYDEEADG